MVFKAKTTLIIINPLKLTPRANFFSLIPFKKAIDSQNPKWLKRLKFGFKNSHYFKESPRFLANSGPGETERRNVSL